MDTPPLDAACVAHLLRRFTNIKPFALAGIWEGAWYWVERQVSVYYLSQPMVPHALYVAALFRLQFVLTDTDPQAKQAFAFAANETLLPYR